MITEQDLHQAISECQGVRDPNANTCLKLASYYTILDHISTEGRQEQYSFVANPQRDIISYNGDSEFGRLINGKELSWVCSMLDELMEALQVINPKLYESFIRKFL